MGYSMDSVGANGVPLDWQVDPSGSAEIQPLAFMTLNLMPPPPGRPTSPSGDDPPPRTVPDIVGFVPRSCGLDSFVGGLDALLLRLENASMEDDPLPFVESAPRGERGCPC
jgi:hypothetical protein